MTYEEARAYIHGRASFSSAAGLHRIYTLMQALGNPQERFQSIHIAGTNGKGSTAAFTASVLKAAGYRTGLFTSPYLIDFEERFQICGVCISKEELTEITREIRDTEAELESLGMEPVNEFELVTAIGFVWFARKRCDYVVLEVGLGGRLDPTNVIRAPACCCITSISLDHMSRLGNTIEQIANEKAGIIKPGCTVVTPADQNLQAMAVIRAACLEKHAKLLPAKAERILSCSQTGAAFLMEGRKIEIRIPGAYQIDNAAAAWTVCRTLGMEPDHIEVGLRSTAWPGRMQLLAESPVVLVDCAHNEDGAENLADNIRTLFSAFRPVMLMSMMADKAHEKCVHLLTEDAVRLYATSLPMPRALPAEALAAEAGCREKYIIPDVACAVRTAFESLKPDEMLVVCGSVYLAGAAIPLLRNILKDGQTAKQE